MHATAVPASAGASGADAAGPGRAAYIDVARIVAIVAVVCIHVLSLVPASVPRGSGRWWLGLTGNAAARWSVPVFVMLSGALLLDPCRRESLGAFYRRRLTRVGVPAVAWIGLYYVFRMLAHHEQLTPARMWREILQARTYYHLYFLYAILGLYAVTPFLRVFVRAASRVELTAVTVLALSAAALDQLLGATAHISSPTYALTLFLPYLGYFLAGYLLRDVRVPAWTGWLLGGVFGVTVAAEVGVSMLLTARGGIADLQVPMSYFSFLTVAMSLSVFLLLARWRPPARISAGSRRRLHLAAAATFGVYLAHPMVLDRLYFYLHLTRGNASAGALVGLVVATTVLTFAAVLVLGRVPGIRRLL